MLLTEQQRGQSVVDNLSLSVAKEMNDSDRIGQLNNLIAMNRELVYWSRYVSDASCNSRDLYFCQPLTQQLLDESRSSNVDLEKTRVQQIDMQRQTMRFQVNNYNVKTSNAAHFYLPWWHSFEPQIVQITPGYIANTATNVVHNNFFVALNDWDERERYIQPKSNLYMANINARLMSPDNDVDFKLAALPAPVEQTTSPARLVNVEVFKPFANLLDKEGKLLPNPIAQIPSAVQVSATMKVATDANKGQVRISSAAACSGAGQLPPPPDEFGLYGGGPNGIANKNLWGGK